MNMFLPSSSRSSSVSNFTDNDSQSARSLQSVTSGASSLGNEFPSKSFLRGTTIRDVPRVNRTVFEIASEFIAAELLTSRIPFPPTGICDGLLNLSWDKAVKIRLQQELVPQYRGESDIPFDMVPSNMPCNIAIYHVC
jgi:hypothetical protein